MIVAAPYQIHAYGDACLEPDKIELACSLVSCESLSLAKDILLLSGAPAGPF